MIRCVIWCQQGTSPDRFHSGIKRPIHVGLNDWLSKVASTSVLGLVEEKLTPFNSLYLFTRRFWRSKANLSKMLAFHRWIFNLVWLASRNQRKYKQHRIFDLQSLLAASSSLSSKGFLCHCIPSSFLNRLSWTYWRIDGKRPKIMLISSESLRTICLAKRKPDVWGRWPKKNGYY